MSIIRYQNHKLDTVSIDGQNWLRSDALGPALGVTARSVRRIIQRNEHRFSADEARLIRLPTSGGTQAVWVVSMKGAEMLALLVSTPQGDEFRQFAFDYFLGRRKPAMDGFRLTAPGSSPPVKELVQALDLVRKLFAAGELTDQVLAEIQDGRRAVPNEEILDQVALQWKIGSQTVSEGGKVQSDAERAAIRSGYSVESLKRRAREIVAAGLLDGPEDADAGL